MYQIPASGLITLKVATIIAAFWITTESSANERSAVQVQPEKSSSTAITGQSAAGTIATMAVESKIVIGLLGSLIIQRHNHSRSDSDPNSEINSVGTTITNATGTTTTGTTTAGTTTAGTTTTGTTTTGTTTTGTTTTGTTTTGTTTAGTTTTGTTTTGTTTTETTTTGTTTTETSTTATSST
jgi:hypothetical protein